MRAVPLSLVLAAIGASQIADIPPLVAAGAIAPALALGSAVRGLGLVEKESVSNAVATMLAGAVLAAIPASHANQFLADRIFSTPESGWAAPSLVAPVVEEIAKGVVILASLLLLPSAGSARAGLTRGVYAGLGFTMMENTQFFLWAAVQGGSSRLAQAIYLRSVLGGLHHAAFSALVGAGIGAALGATPRRPGMAPLACLSGIALHVAWNFAGAGFVANRLCGAAGSDPNCLASPPLFDLLITAPLACASVLAGTAGLLRAFRIARPRARRPRP